MLRSRLTISEAWQRTAALVAAKVTRRYYAQMVTFRRSNAESEEPPRYLGSYQNPGKVWTPALGGEKRRKCRNRAVQ